MYVEPSYTLTEGDPVYPDNPEDLFEPRSGIENGDPINTTKEDLNVPEGSDLIIFRTGFGKPRTEKPATYRFDFPGFERDAARYIRENLGSVKAIMVDFISVDQIVESVN